MAWRDLLFWKRQKVVAPVEAAKPVSFSTELNVRVGRERKLGVTGAQIGGGASAWGGTGSDYNREYLDALRVCQQRAQDLDVNNPDAHGHHRVRAAQVIGRGVKWSAALKGDEIGVSPKRASEISDAINRKRRQHSKRGGFDASGRGRSEGKLQEISFLTMQVLGSVLIHRVIINDPARVSSLAIENIPSTRLSTPHDKAADPTVSYGIKYSDEYRTKIVGYYVKRVPRSVGNAMLAEEIWDYVPAEDCILLSLTEIAGLDRALPALTSLVRMLRNKGDFIESAVRAARVQARRAVAIKCAPGTNPFDAAGDDQQQSGESSDVESNPVGFVTIGDAEFIYVGSEEEVTNLAAALPNPDYKGFIDVADSRCARGLVTSKSRFTREVQSSYSAGRQEEQQDEPVVDQLRESFENAWQRVHGWFVDSLYLNVDNTELFETYNEATREFFHEAEIMPMSAKLAINPVDTANARRQGYANRTLTPQQACAEEGKDFEGNMREWAVAVKLVRQIEKENELPEGALDILLDVPLKEAIADAAVEGGASDVEKKQGKAFAEKLVPISRIGLNGKNGVSHAKV